MIAVTPAHLRMPLEGVLHRQEVVNQRAMSMLRLPTCVQPRLVQHSTAVGKSMLHRRELAQSGSESSAGRSHSAQLISCAHGFTHPINCYSLFFLCVSLCEQRWTAVRDHTPVQSPVPQPQPISRRLREMASEVLDDCDFLLELAEESAQEKGIAPPPAQPPRPHPPQPKPSTATGEVNAHSFTAKTARTQD